MRRARGGRFAELFQQYQVLRKHFQHRPRRRSEEAEIGPDARSEALAQIAASAAAHDNRVATFRRRFLDDHLLPVEEIPSWIEERVRREGQAAAEYVLVPLPSESVDLLDNASTAHEGYMRWLAHEAARVAADPRSEAPGNTRLGPRMLEYALPGERSQQIQIRGDGVLAELKRLASDELGGVGHRIPWREADVVAFILSGWIPSLPKARFKVLTLGYFTGQSRLTIDVDPRLSPKDVAQVYNRLRKRRAKGRDRPMDEKHLALAVFAEKTRRNRVPWSQLRQRWNDENPQWTFSVDEDRYAKRFALECRTAWSRVTGERWGTRFPGEARSGESPERRGDRHTGLRT